MRCLTSAKMNMTADILRQDSSPVDLDPDSTSGHYENQQHPITGEIIRVWVPDIQDNPDTPEDEHKPVNRVECIFRGVIDGGIRVAGTTERFGNLYENVDYGKMTVASNVIITKRDRVTNVRDSTGKIMWVEEELGLSDVDGVPTYKATVFNVLGVTPVPSPFGRHVENFVLLERAGVDAS